MCPRHPCEIGLDDARKHPRLNGRDDDLADGVLCQVRRVGGRAAQRTCNHIAGGDKAQQLEILIGQHIVEQKFEQQRLRAGGGGDEDAGQQRQHNETPVGEQIVARGPLENIECLEVLGIGRGFAAWFSRSLVQCLASVLLR